MLGWVPGFDWRLSGWAEMMQGEIRGQCGSKEVVSKGKERRVRLGSASPTSMGPWGPWLEGPSFWGQLTRTAGEEGC
jgi:hypothetical protein